MRIVTAPARRVPRLLAIGAILIAVSAAAQYALDAGLSAYGRYNAPRAAPKLNQPIYTVNRATGEMQYNRANAFNDPVYNIHQRYTHDRFQYYSPSGVATGATASRPTSQSFRPQTGSRPYAGGASSYTSVTARPPPPARAGYTPSASSASSASRYGSLNASTYRPASASRSSYSGISKATYSPTRR